MCEVEMEYERIEKDRTLFGRHHTFNNGSISVTGAPDTKTAAKAFGGFAERQLKDHGFTVTNYGFKPDHDMNPGSMVVSVKLGHLHRDLRSWIEHDLRSFLNRTDCLYTIKWEH